MSMLFWTDELVDVAVASMRAGIQRGFAGAPRGVHRPLQAEEEELERKGSRHEGMRAAQRAACCSIQRHRAFWAHVGTEVCAAAEKWELWAAGVVADEDRRSRSVAEGVLSMALNSQIPRLAAESASAQVQEWVSAVWSDAATSMMAVYTDALWESAPVERSLLQRDILERVCVAVFGVCSIVTKLNHPMSPQLQQDVSNAHAMWSGLQTVVDDVCARLAAMRVLSSSDVDVPIFSLRRTGDECGVPCACAGDLLVHLCLTAAFFGSGARPSLMNAKSEFQNSVAVLRQVGQTHFNAELGRMFRLAPTLEGPRSAIVPNRTFPLLSDLQAAIIAAVASQQPK